MDNIRGAKVGAGGFGTRPLLKDCIVLKTCLKDISLILSGGLEGGLGK